MPNQPLHLGDQKRMASFHPSPLTSRKTPRGSSSRRQNSTFLSQSGLDDTLHSTQSLSGRCSIMTYKSKQYPSASAALAAYISDFEDDASPSRTYHRTVEDLLTPRSVLLQTVDRSLDTGVRDTRAEWRRYISKKLLDESYSEMVQADVEREKAQALIESSRHLMTTDLSPLPGSSVITEVESQASVSTDALLLAPPYPSLRHPPPPRSKDAISGRSEPLRQGLTSENGNYRNQSGAHPLESRIQNLRDRAKAVSGRPVVVAKPRVLPPRVPKFQSDVSPVKKLVTSSAAALDKGGHLDNVVLPLTHLGGDNLQLRREANNNRARERLVSSAGPKEFSSRVASRDGQRPPPSWIQDLDASSVSGLPFGTNPGGRAPPSWIHDLDASGLSSLTTRTHPSGRAPPSWVQELEVSRASSPAKAQTPEQLHVDGGRPPPSWIQDLNSTLTSGWHDTSSSLKPVTTQDFALRRRTTQKSSGRDILRRSSDPSTSDMHNGTELSEKQPLGLTYQDFDSSEGFFTSVDPVRHREGFHEVSASSGGDHHPKKAVKFMAASGLKKAYSFTTDDLILASPTGKDFHLPDHHSRLQSSQQNRFSLKHPSHINSERHLVSGNGYSPNRLASWGGAESPRGTSNPDIQSLRGGTSALLSSTPKHSIAFGSSPVSQPVRHLDDKGSSLWRKEGYVENQQTGKIKGTLEEADRQREDALLQRVQKVLEAARASKSKPIHSSQRYHQDADRQEDADRHDNSLLTEEVLEGDRPWERSLPVRKPLPLVEQGHFNQQDIVAKFLDDCLKSAGENQKLTGGSQPGPVEALKNMLFTLQGIDSTSSTPAADGVPSAYEKEKAQILSPIATSSNTSPGLKDERCHKNPRMATLHSDTSSSSGSRTNFDEAPGGKSLQRAMQHLSRLKVLVNGVSHQNSHPSSTNAHVTSS